MRAVAIIGAGIGAQHLAGFLKLPDHYLVAAVCDLDIARARTTIESVAGKNSGIAATADFDAILRDSDIEIVDICLPPHLHLSAATDALRAGKHVICEKPMVASLQDADTIMAEAKNANRMLSPVFQYRFGPAMTRLRALIDAGLVGKPFAAALETHWDRGTEYYAVPWRGTWAGENGGAVLGHAIHNHDLLTSLLGPVAAVSAFTGTRVNDIETEDCAAISFEMANGALATSSITLGAATNTSRLRLTFEQLTAESGPEPYAPMSQDWTFTARSPSSQADVDAVLAGVEDNLSGFAGYFAEFAKALDGKPSEAVTPEDGRRSLELITAIYAAARTGTRVHLPLKSTHQGYRGWAPAMIAEAAR